MDVTALPTPPNRADLESKSKRKQRRYIKQANLFLAALRNFVAEENAVAAQQKTTESNTPS